MVAYAVIVFLTAVIFGIVAALISRGKTELIHEYHRTKVTDKAAYGKAFGKAMGAIAVAMAVSGGIALLGKAAMGYAVAVLLLGLAAGIAAIVRVQRKYNGGIF